MKKVWLLFILLLLWAGLALAAQKPPAGTLIKPGHPDAQGLVGCWLFNEGTGNAAQDLSGNGNDGVLYGPTWVPGRDGWSLDFNDDDVTLPGGTSFRGRDKFTISAWVRADTLAGYSSIYYESIAGSFSTRVYLFMNSGTLIFGGRAPDASGFVNWNTYPTTLSVGQLYHIVAVYNTSEASGFRQKLYVNGVVNNGGTEGDTITDSSSLKIQIGKLNTVQPWDGTIYLFHIYSRALSAAEIMWLYISPYTMLQQQQVWQWFVAPPISTRRIFLVY